MCTKRIFARRLLAGSFFACLFSAAVYSQSLNATLGGTVIDPNGAVVPGAQITLTDVGTGAVTTVTSGGEGLFSFPNLQRGSYELKVSAKGFQDFVQKGIS